MSTEAINLQRITEALDDHNGKCEFEATAIVMNPFEVSRLGWDEVKGVPIIGDPSVPTGRMRIECDKPDENLIDESELLAPPEYAGVSPHYGAE